MNISDMERVDALWFPDGSIVICAHGVLFRVYRGILSARSPVFADLLAFQQPDDAETVDGCPVMHLDDSAADMMYFLKALFDYEFFAPYPAKTDFDAIHGVLRLGTKYRVEPLRRRALQHLSSAHPTSLAAWDALCAAAAPSTSSSKPVSLPPPLYAGPSFDFSHLELPVITLAREARADWILPTAFYRVLASLSSAEILDGIDYTSLHVELDRADKVLLLEAGPVLLGERTAEILGFLWSPTVIPGCERAGAASTGTSTNTSAGSASASSGIMNACTSNRLAMRVAAERWRSDALLPICVSLGGPMAAAGAEQARDEMEADVDAVADGEESRERTAAGDDGKEGEAGAEEDAEAEGGRAIWSEEDFARLAVCGPCLAHMKADWAARRARFWERLPGLFGLPTWAELERRRAEEVEC